MSWKAVVAGVLIEAVGSLLTLVALVLVVAAVRHIPSSSIPGAVMADRRVAVLSILLYAGWSFLGGFAAGNISKRNRFLHGLAVGVLVLGYEVWNTTTPAPWFKLVANVTVLPMAVVGAVVTRSSARAASV